MQRPSWIRRGALVGVALVLALGATAWAAEPPEFPNPYFGQPEPLKVSDYWLGLACYPVQEALRAQLNLPEDQGLVVGQVVPDSPAAKAGIQEHDVLLKADDKPIGKLQDLIDAVDAAKENELTLEVLRGGKPIQIKAQPTKRPESQVPLPGPKGFEDPNWERMKKYFEQFKPGEGGKPPWRWRIWGPGMILPPDAEPRPPLPGNVSVAITKAGDEPARIVVKRGDEKWEVTENELDKLPEDVRPHIERMLGATTAHPGGKVWSYDFDFVPEFRVPHWEGWQEGGLEKRMEELNRRIEELRKSLDEMREKRPRLKPAPKLKEAPAPKEEAPEKQPEQKQDKV